MAEGWRGWGWGWGGVGTECREMMVSVIISDLHPLLPDRCRHYHPVKMENILSPGDQHYRMEAIPRGKSFQWSPQWRNKSIMTVIVTMPTRKLLVKNEKEVILKMFSILTGERTREDIEDSHPGKCKPLVKTHKQKPFPIRLLLSGCGTPIQPLSRFVQLNIGHLTEYLPFQILDTKEFLKKISEINNTFAPLPDSACFAACDVPAVPQCFH